MGGSNVAFSKVNSLYHALEMHACSPNMCIRAPILLPSRVWTGPVVDKSPVRPEGF